MPNILFPEAIQDYAEKQVAAGIYANISEVARAGIRKLMEEDGAAAFYALRRDIEAAIAAPTVEVDLRAMFLNKQD